tara:strand:- start:959 stop:1363 length:405 start_codon:yes stop_codon:yes gene_type:complete
MIKIQKKDFNLEKEINLIKSKHKNVGGVSTFIGYVKNTNNNKKVKHINLEVYEDMAFKYLNDVCMSAKKKWQISDFLVIHRFGKLEINEKIVLVATFSINRKDSYKASKYIMDFLKKDAPFWKKEFYKKDYSWL